MGEMTSNIGKGIGIALGLAAGLWVLAKLGGIEADYTDPLYMKGDSEFPEKRTSNNDYGNTLLWEEGPIGRISPHEGGGGRNQSSHCRCPAGDYQTIIEEGQSCSEVNCLNHGYPLVPGNITRGGPARRQGDSSRRVEADYPVFTGNTYLHPELLPPLHTYRLQGYAIGGGRIVNPEYLPEVVVLE